MSSTVASRRMGLRTSPAIRVLQAAGLLAVIGTLVWFTIPVFAGEYNEGFQTVIVMNARAILNGGFDRVDLLYPLVNDFFLASRFGVAIVMAGLLKLGLSPVTAFRLVMLVSLIVLVGANATILVRRYRVHPVFACLPALLFPGTFESAWFFNDNVLSAALSSAALALVWTRRSLAATAICAVLWGMAIACRTDAVLLAPAFVLLMWFELPLWRDRLRHALVAAPLVAATPLLIYGVFGLNFLDILALTHRATVAWARKDQISHLFHPLLKGFAPPGMVAMAIGAVTVLVRRQWREIMLCLVVPLLYGAAYGLLMTEVRYLLPLTPFFGILMVEGARATLRAAPRWRSAGIAVFAVTFLVCFGPPILLPLHSLWFLSTDDDMPRPTVGRFWSPVLSMWWNHKLAEGYDAAAVAVAAAAKPGGLGVVVTTRWTPDHTVELILRDDGFAVSRATTPASCHEIGEVFTRGNDRILHLRDHIPLIPTERSAVTWQALGAPCLRDMGMAATDRVLVVGEMVLEDPMPGAGTPGIVPLYVPAMDLKWGGAIAGKSDGYFVATAPIDEVPAMLLPVQPYDEPGGAEWAIAHRDLLR